MYHDGLTWRVLGGEEEVLRVPLSKITQKLSIASTSWVDNGTALAYKILCYSSLLFSISLLLDGRILLASQTSTPA